MALIVCPDCGKEFSDQAAACPNCGRPNSNRPSPTAPADTAKKKTGCGTWLVLGIVAVVGLGVIGENTKQSQSPADRAADAQVTHDYALRGAAEATIKAGLRDPESADFKDVIVVHRDTVSTVCGSVNAKNGFGGFTGYTDFMTYHGRVMVQSSDNSDVFVPRWNKWCAKLAPVPRARNATP